MRDHPTDRTPDMHHSPLMQARSSGKRLASDLGTFTKAHPVFVVLLGLVMLTRLDTIISSVLAFVIPVAVLALPVVAVVWGARTLRARSREEATIIGTPLNPPDSLYRHRHIQ